MPIISANDSRVLKVKEKMNEVIHFFDENIVVHKREKTFVERLNLLSPGNTVVELADMTPEVEAEYYEKMEALFAEIMNQFGNPPPYVSKEAEESLKSDFKRIEEFNSYDVFNEDTFPIIT